MVGLKERGSQCSQQPTISAVHAEVGAQQQGFAAHSPVWGSARKAAGAQEKEFALQWAPVLQEVQGEEQALLLGSSPRSWGTAGVNILFCFALNRLDAFPERTVLWKH